MAITIKKSIQNAGAVDFPRCNFLKGSSRLLFCKLVQLSKLVVHPSPPRSMLEHTAKDAPEDASFFPIFLLNKKC